MSIDVRICPACGVLPAAEGDRYCADCGTATDRSAWATKEDVTMSHDYHPAASASGVLSAGCEDCRRKLIGDLDDDYRESACGITRDKWERLADTAPWMQMPILTMSALQVQREYIRWLALGTMAQRERAKAMDRAMHADPGAKATHARAGAWTGDTD